MAPFDCFGCRFELEGVEVDDSLRRFSSKSCRVMGRFKRLVVELQNRSLETTPSRPPQPFRMSGFDGVATIDDDERMMGEAVRFEIDCDGCGCEL